jgi:hypothetical protein
MFQRGHLSTHQGDERRKPLQAASPRGSSRKLLDIMNFMNFAAGSPLVQPLEFTARHATSGPE